MFKFIFLSSFLLVGFISQNIHGEEVECPNIHCPEYDLKKYIIEEWKTPKSLTPLFKEYRDAILELIEDANDRDMVNLYGQTAWVNVQLMNLKASLGANCVFKMVIQQILKPTSEKDSIMEKYTELCSHGLTATKDVAMVNAGCIDYNEISPEIPPGFKNHCKTDDLVEEVLNSNRTEMHEKLKPIVSKMVRSNIVEESMAGTTALMATTTAIVDFFDRIAKLEPHNQFVKFHNCRVQIPSECCAAKREYINNMTIQLEKDTVASCVKMSEELNY